MLVISISIEGIIGMVVAADSNQKQAENTSNRLAILGLLLVVFPPAGFIVSIIAGRRSALKGKPNTLAVIGTIINAILLLVGTIFIVSYYRNGHYIDPRAKDPAVSDELTFENMKKLHKEMQRYIREKGELPMSLDDLKTLDGFDSKLTRDARGTRVALSWSPVGCESIDDCKAYSLRAVGHKTGWPMEIAYDASEGKTYYHHVPKQ